MYHQPPTGSNQPTPHVCQRCDEPLTECVCEDVDDWGDYYAARAEALCENPPPAPAGFQLVECNKSPRHWPTYTVLEDDYGAPCMYCAWEQLNEAHSGCEHSHHGRWRRWRIAKWLVTQSYVSGLTAGGYGYSMNAHCDWCLSTLPRWRGKRAYVLWVKRETWRCLLRGRHLPGDHIAFGYCSKCLPCPECRSTTAGHHDGCAALS